MPNVAKKKKHTHTTKLDVCFVFIFFLFVSIASGFECGVSGIRTVCAGTCTYSCQRFYWNILPVTPFSELLIQINMVWIKFVYTFGMDGMPMTSDIWWNYKHISNSDGGQINSMKQYHLMLTIFFAINLCPFSIEFQINILRRLYGFIRLLVNQ